MTCGIYSLNFKGTDKIYIGLSINIEGGYRKHTCALRKNQAPQKLQEAYNLYGMPTYEVLIEDVETNLENLEKEAIEVFDAIDNGFNSRDGGAVGASLTIRGEKNGRAKYTDEIYINIFFDILNTKDTYIDIAKKYGVSTQIVDHIALGISHSAWLSRLFPEEYSRLPQAVLNRRKIELEIINIKTKEERTIYSLLDFSKESGIPKATLSGLKTGALKNARDWVLKVPVQYNPKIKKYYKLRNTNSGEFVSFNNVLGFCREYGIQNRKTISVFLKKEEIGTKYYEWELIAISENNSFT